MRMTLKKPNGGENWQTETSYTIEWSTTLTSALARIELEKNGEYCLTTVESTPYTKHITWTSAGGRNNVNIELYSSLSDMRDGYFEIWEHL